MFIIFNTGKSGKEIIRYDNKLQDVLHTKEKNIITFGGDCNGLLIFII